MGDAAQQEREKVAIVGGGITGLYCAYILKKNNYDVHLFEETNRAIISTNGRGFERRSRGIFDNFTEILFENRTSSGWASEIGHGTPMLEAITLGVQNDVTGV